jgi:hypothetical protein
LEKYMQGQLSMILMTMLPVEAHAEERCRVAP